MERPPPGWLYTRYDGALSLFRQSGTAQESPEPSKPRDVCYNLLAFFGKGVAQTKTENLTRGASVMVISVTIAKILGILYIVPLTELIGSSGLGIYQNAYALYIILLTLATSGFPTAMGKLVSEHLAKHKYADVELLYRTTLRSVFVLGAIATIATWIGAPFYSHLVAVMAPKSTASAYIVPSIRALAPSVLVVSMESVLRGYLQGFQKMEPSGYSQTVEQLFRILTMLVGAYIVYRMHLGIARGAAAATFGSFVGALAGLLLLILAVRPIRSRFVTRSSQQRPSMSPKQALRLLYRLALPVSLGALVVPLSGFADSLTVQNFLMMSGRSFHQATSDFGILSRQAFTLIQLPLAFAMAIGASVLPAVAAASALRDRNAVERNITGTIRAMFFVTFPTAAALLVLARPIDYLLFGSYQGAHIISSISFMGVFSGLELISTYLLQGLGNMYRPVRNMFLGVIVKIVFNFALILPFGIMGAAIASTIGYLFSSTLNVLAVRKYSRVNFSAWRLALPSLVTTVILCIILWIANAGAASVFPYLTHSLRLVSLLQFLFAITIGGMGYVVISIRLRAVSVTELQRLPAIGTRLARFASRVQPRQLPTR